MHRVVLECAARVAALFFTCELSLLFLFCVRYIAVRNWQLIILQTTADHV